MPGRKGAIPSILSILACEVAPRWPGTVCQNCTCGHIGNSSRYERSNQIRDRLISHRERNPAPMTNPHHKKARRQRAEREETPDAPDYDALLLLERMESLLEEMDELGVSNREEIAARIAALNEALDKDEG